MTFQIFLSSRLVDERVRRMAHEYHIGVVVGMARAYGRAIFRGALAYARGRANWSFAADPAHLSIEQLYACDGAIMHVDTPTMLDVARHLKRPIVQILSRNPLFDAPTVCPDDRRVGDMVARHLQERGCEQFGYVTATPASSFSVERADGFMAALREMGHEVSCMPPAGKASSRLETADLAAWLLDMRKPAGVMASHDATARQVLQVCHELGLRVPEDVAVVGVDNDDILCETATPPLSSVAIPVRCASYVSTCASR
jgi:LacI family transcriptional regulator